MARFSDFGIQPSTIVGKGILIDDLIGRRIVIERVKIDKTKFENDKTRLHLRMQMQIVLASFRESADEAGDYFVKDRNGAVVGEQRSCFTGSDNLIETVQEMQSRVTSVNEQRKREGLPPLDVFPLDCTIQRSGKCLIFQ